LVRTDACGAEGCLVSEVRDTTAYDLHGALTLRTNTRIVPEIPEYLRAETADPDLDLIRLDEMEVPKPDAIRSMIGQRSVCDLGGGEVFYQLPLPLLAYLGVSGNWAFRVRGLAETKTAIETALPYVRLKPVESRVTELLSKVVYLVLNLKLWRRGYALCHASSVARGESAFLFFGYIGSGKTTASLGLMDSVCDGYLSDDVTLVHRDGRVFCWPEYHPAHGEGISVPGLRYLRKRQHSMVVPEFPIRHTANARYLFFLESGGNRVREIDLDEAARRVLLINADELSRHWNSPGSQIVNQYAYFYPGLDLGQAFREFAGIVDSMVRRTERAFVVQSNSPKYETLRELATGLG